MAIVIFKSFFPFFDFFCFGSRPSQYAAHTFKSAFFVCLYFVCVFVRLFL